jgi:hypothetical protein
VDAGLRVTSQDGIRWGVRMGWHGMGGDGFRSNIVIVPTHPSSILFMLDPVRIAYIGDSICITIHIGDCLCVCEMLEGRVVSDIRNEPDSITTT